MPKRLNRFVLLFSSIVTFTILYNVFFAYDQLQRIDETRLFVSKNQATTLKALLLSFRETYQQIFIKNHIPLDDLHLDLLPVKNTPTITEKLSKKMKNKIFVKTVSDRPRNPDNRADPLEMESIEYFKKHPDAKEIYRTIEKEKEEFFYYAAPLRITKRCLVCHGPRQKAPTSIQARYNKAYDYHLGDLRGIIAIYLSQESLKKAIAPIVYRNIFTNVAITLLFLAAFYFLLKKIYRQDLQYTHNLEKAVIAQTKAIKRQSKELEYRLYHDSLTQLPNRNALINDISSQKPKALLLVNIDDFNEINDFYGHDKGDEILKAFCHILAEKCQTPLCNLYRMPSDEFALLFHEEMNEKSLLRIIDDLIERVKRHDFVIDKNNIIHLRIAIGASLQKDNLLITADMAIKKAKADRVTYVLYNDAIDLEHRYKQNLEWAEKLKWALENDGIIPYYQPIVNTSDGSIKGYEALIRLLDDRGLVHTPIHFLEIAKHTKYYPQLTKRMVDKVFEDFAQMPYHVSLNISYLDIVNKETMDYIMDKIATFDNAERVHFEILESEGIERYEDVFRPLQRLKSLGCQLSLDDFGSGYSNFEHILKLEVDMLKIDGSLIRNIHQDIGSQIIVETIIDFSRKLQIETCAEFVGSEEVYETLKDLGVTYMQGYYFAEPKPKNDLV